MDYTEHTNPPADALPVGSAVQCSTDALCWWCRIDLIDGSIGLLAHRDYRFLCRKCRQMMEIFASYYGRLQEMTLVVARDELMKLIGLERVAMRLEMAEMRERVDVLLARAHEATAWVNGVPPARLDRTQGPRHTPHTLVPRVEIPAPRRTPPSRKDVS